MGWRSFQDQLLLFDGKFLVEFCWLPATLIAILLDHFDGYSVQLALPEECFQLFEIGAMTSHGVLGEASEMGPLELRTQVLERSPLPWPPDLEQSKHDLALAFLPYLGSEFLAGCLGRFAILLTVHRVTHPPESSCFSFVQAQWRSYHLPELGADPIIAPSREERRDGRRCWFLKRSRVLTRYWRRPQNFRDSSCSCSAWRYSVLFEMPR